MTTPTKKKKKSARDELQENAIVVEKMTLPFFEHQMARVDKQLALTAFAGALLGKSLDILMFSLIGLKKAYLLMGLDQALHWMLMPALWLIISVQLAVHLKHLLQARKYRIANAKMYLHFIQQVLFWALVTAAVSFMLVPALGSVTILGFAGGPVLFIGALTSMALLRLFSSIFNLYQACHFYRQGERLLGRQYLNKAGENFFFHSLVLAGIVVSATLTMLIPIGIPAIAFLGVGMAGLVILRMVLPVLVKKLQTNKLSQKQIAQDEARLEVLKTAAVEEMGLERSLSPVMAKPRNVLNAEASSSLRSIGFFSRNVSPSSQLFVYRHLLKNPETYYRVVENSDHARVLQIMNVKNNTLQAVGRLNHFYERDKATLQSMIAAQDAKLLKQKSSFRMETKRLVLDILRKKLTKLPEMNTLGAQDLQAFLKELHKMNQQLRVLYQSSRMQSRTAFILEAALSFVRGYLLLVPQEVGPSHSQQSRQGPPRIIVAGQVGVHYKNLDYCVDATKLSLSAPAMMTLRKR